jgi:hypothetical protein
MTKRPEIPNDNPNSTIVRTPKLCASMYSSAPVSGETARGAM